MSRAGRLRAVTVDDEALRALDGRTVAVIGYGAQGQAHALNLRDSGVNVVIGQREGSPRHAAATLDRFAPMSVGQAAASADVLILGLPDEAIPEVYEREIRPRLRAGQSLGFLHGFAVRFNRIAVPGTVDVIMVAPKAQGRAVRREFLVGRGVAALVAVGQDASGRARSTALAWAVGIGAGRSAIYETTFADETETDLFGEQVVLCGGLTSLIKAAFETLVEAGYPAELAYFECCHEVALLAELLHDGGLTYMRERISNTARYGDLTRGPRVVNAQAREEMRRILEEIRSGRFAEELAAEQVSGYARFRALTEADRGHLLERVGAEVRKRMWGAAEPGGSSALGPG